MQVIHFVLLTFFKLITSDDVNQICTNIDDQILMVAIQEISIDQTPHCSDGDDPYNDVEQMRSIEWVIHGALNCHVKDLRQFLRNYFEKQINCTSHFEEWSRYVETPRIIDTRTCKLRIENHFNELNLFLDYLKLQNIPKDTYTRMIISAQCNIEKAMNQYYRAMKIFDSQSNFLKTYINSLLVTTKGKRITYLLLVDDLKNSLVYREWTTNRYLSSLLQCFLQDSHVDIALDSPDKPFIPAPEASNLGLERFLLILGSVSVTTLIIVTILYKRGTLKRKTLVLFDENGVDWRVRQNLICHA
ncbi:hypothetical protein RF11_05445 [Thelohanellus kitauei]|uniref:Uncharacterized protein n=1 Tax=Thelohanellus kitauei TaxID=669202 RepID=A0A0C2IYJ5_THEKT|nr:hypothetical protein RF11_05445 [Thelohanellus kitauei]